MASKTVADLIVDTLKAAGVKRIFGVVGDSLNGITDALRRDGTIEWLHMRHEEAAAFAASGEAQVTGTLAVCAGSCGPGNLHLINGLFDAHRTRVPGAGNRGPHPVRRDRRRLLPGNPSRRTCSRNARIIASWSPRPRRCPTHAGHAPSAPRSASSGVAGAGDPRRRRRCMQGPEAEPRHAAAMGLLPPPPDPRAAPAELDALAALLERRRARHAVLRPRLRRRACP